MTSNNNNVNNNQVFLPKEKMSEHVALGRALFRSTLDNSLANKLVKLGLFKAPNVIECPQTPRIN